MKRVRTLGIDLGTTNTVAAVHGDVVQARGQGAVMPSVVAYPPSGERLVGAEARLRAVIDPRHTIMSAKRVIGAHWTSAEATRFRDEYPYEFVRTADDRIAFHTRAGDLTSIDVGAAIVGEVSEGLDPTQHQVVVSVPTRFDDHRRKATVDAVAHAGFGVISLIDEPVATAMAYLDRSSLKYAAVYDMGGGTFDVAIVDCSDYPFRVVGHAGDPYLGGDDIDRILAHQVAQEVLKASRWDLQECREIFSRLVMACEAAKCQLGSRDAALIDVSSIDPACPANVPAVLLNAERVQSLAHNLVRRTFSICDEALDMARLVAKDIDAVFLAGGSTQLPGLRDAVKAYFGKQPRFDLPPMHVVALGASLAAARPRAATLLEAAL